MAEMADLFPDDLIAAGERIADRFELEHLIGSGGMGAVWRATDRARGETVALKVTADPEGGNIAWSEREARALIAIHHPAVARYVAHGVTPEGIHYLATEWLDGEDLGTRLRRGPLGLQGSLRLAGKVAEALTAVHAAEIVHCDVKPWNLFLVGGRIGRVKLMDFGIARLPSAEEPCEGGVVGTPSYMAPEQAFGAQYIDARTDLYALGAVLFECLTGRSPFVATNAMAALTKAIFEPAPLPSEVRPGLPPAVDALVAELLAKDKAKRPESASVVAQEIRLLLASRGRSGTRVFARTLTRTERRLISVVLAVAPERAGPGSHRSDPRSTLSVLPRHALPLPELRALAERHGAELEVLGDGSLAALLSGSGAPTDMAASAARYALSVRTLVPESDVAVATGWQVFTGMQPLGQVIDRASARLHARAAGSGGHVLVDEMTAALLGDRFAVSGDDHALTLTGERELVEHVPRLLGKPIPCVGRERELAALEALCDESAAEKTARAVIVTAGPGVGKSRLWEELVRRLRTRPDVEIFLAHGDAAQRGAPFGMLGQAVRRAARLIDGEPVEVRRQKLAARVARHVDGAIQRRVTEFLGEMVGTAFPSEESVQLRAARQEPMLLSDQMRRAWVELLEAECRAHPVVLVLDDLQWCDRPTVDFVDTALRLLEHRPLVVLASARPEVAQVFPGLWADRRPTPLALGELPRDACEELVRQSLGDGVPDEQVARIIERSACNAFFLEELVRAVAEHRGDDLPDTVLAMMQSRLESLEPEARRTLRAASLLGGRFWSGAVAALLGVAPDAPRLAQQLADLERQEWITRLHGSTFRREAEYTFRHSLVREAAYGMLTDEDRALGHRLAGQWLERAGERNAMVLAEHFDLGKNTAKAALWYHLAAEQALKGNDLGAAIARVDRAIACGAHGEALGELSLITAEAHRWQGGFGEGVQWAQRALEAFPRGSDRWFAALREALASLVDVQDRGKLLAIADLLDELWSDPARASGAQVTAMAWMAIRLFALSLHDRAETFHERLRAVEERFAEEPAVHACVAMERAFREGYLVNDMGSFSDALRVAVERFEHTGDVRSASHMRVNLGHAYNELGAYRENVELLSGLLASARRLGLGHVEATARSHLGKALLGLGRVEAARAEVEDAIRAFVGHGDERMEGVSRAYLAILLDRSGSLDQAEAEARRAIALLGPLAALQPFAWAVLAAVLLRSDRLPEALEAAARASAQADQAEEGEALIRLVHAEVLERSGDHAAARGAISAARGRLLARADTIANAARRRSFLEEVPENARTIALAKAWLEGD